MGRNNKRKYGIPHDIHKPGTAKYYRDQLINIADVLIDYDGCDLDNSRQLKELIDDIKQMALKAIAHKKLYIKSKE